MKRLHQWSFVDDATQPAAQDIDPHPAQHDRRPRPHHAQIDRGYVVDVFLLELGESLDEESGEAVGRCWPE